MSGLESGLGFGLRFSVGVRVRVESGFRHLCALQHREPACHRQESIIIDHRFLQLCWMLRLGEGGEEEWREEEGERLGRGRGGEGDEEGKGTRRGRGREEGDGKRRGRGQEGDERTHRRLNERGAIVQTLCRVLRPPLFRPLRDRRPSSCSTCIPADRAAAT